MTGSSMVALTLMPLAEAASGAAEEDDDGATLDAAVLEVDGADD
jgi:hypothetical protein